MKRTNLTIFTIIAILIVAGCSDSKTGEPGTPTWGATPQPNPTTSTPTQLPLPTPTDLPNGEDEPWEAVEAPDSLGDYKPQPTPRDRPNRNTPDPGAGNTPPALNISTVTELDNLDTSDRETFFEHHRETYHQNVEPITPNCVFDTWSVARAPFIPETVFNDSETVKLRTLRGTYDSPQAALPTPPLVSHLTPVCFLGTGDGMVETTDEGLELFASMIEPVMDEFVKTLQTERGANSVGYEKVEHLVTDRLALRLSVGRTGYLFQQGTVTETTTTIKMVEPYRVIVETGFTTTTGFNGGHMYSVVLLGDGTWRIDAMGLLNHTPTNQNSDNNPEPRERPNRTNAP